MSNRIRIYTKVTPEELARIREKMVEVDVRNRSAYLRKMALDGYCVNMDFSDIRELVSLLRRCSNNLNQYAKKADNGSDKTDRTSCEQGQVCRCLPRSKNRLCEESGEDGKGKSGHFL